MRHLKAAGLCLLGLIAVCAGCDRGGNALFVAVQYPAEYELPADVKVIAVTPFNAQTREAQAYAETAVGILAARLNETIGPMGTNRCKIVERANLKDLLREADLGDAGITDAATAAKAGKMLNADALIFGTLQAEQKDERGTKSEQYFDPIAKQMRSRSVPTIRRTVLVSMAFKVVRPESAELIISKAFQENYDSGQIGAEAGSSLFGSGGGSGSLPSMDEATLVVVRKCVNKFYGTIAPHVQCFSVQLAGGKSELAKSGIGLAEQHVYSEAATMFEQASQADPEDHGSLYNLGLMKLMQGDLPAAKAEIQKAIAMKSDKKYQQAYGQIVRLSNSAGRLQFRPANEQEIAECQQDRRGSRK